LPDLTKKNENIKKYNEKLENRLAKLKWTSNHFEQEYISDKLEEEVKKSEEEVKKSEEEVKKSEEEVKKSEEEVKKINEENEFINLIEDIKTGSRTITNDELEKWNNFLNKYDETYPLYNKVKGLIYIFKDYYNENYKD